MRRIILIIAINIIMMIIIIIIIQRVSMALRKFKAACGHDTFHGLPEIVRQNNV